MSGTESAHLPGAYARSRAAEFRDGCWAFGKIATLGLVAIVFGPVMNVIACQLVA